MTALAAAPDDWAEGDRVRNRLTGERGTVASAWPEREADGWLWRVDTPGGERCWHSFWVEAAS